MLDLPSINQVIATWWQGDYVLMDELPTKFQFDMQALLAKDEQEDPSEEAIGWSPTPVEGFMVVSQTCDVVRAWNGRDDRKWVLVAPLVKPGVTQWKGILKGKFPRFHVTASLVEAGLALDLERALTISKAVLAALTPHRRSGCGTQDERRSLSQRLSEKAYRPALPDDFTSSERGKEGAIFDLEVFLDEGPKTRGDLRDFLDALDEVRIMPRSEDPQFPWDARVVQVLFYFVLNTENIAPDDRERWEECAQDIVAHMKTTGRFHLLGTGYAVRTWNELSAAEYRSSDWLPIHRQPTPPAPR